MKKKISEIPHEARSIATLYRCLQILKLITDGWYTVSEIAEYSGVHTRTIYRYLKVFQAVGFNIEVDDKYRYHNWISIERKLGKNEKTRYTLSGSVGKNFKKLIMSGTQESELLLMGYSLSYIRTSKSRMRAAGLIKPKKETRTMLFSKNKEKILTMKQNGASNKEILISIGTESNRSAQAQLTNWLGITRD